jgi:hypothetical protein
MVSNFSDISDPSDDYSLDSSALSRHDCQIDGAQRRFPSSEPDARTRAGDHESGAQ